MESITSNEYSPSQMKDVKDFLRDAGLLDSTMTNREMWELSLVLKNSQNTATEEEAQRRHLQHAEQVETVVEGSPEQIEDVDRPFPVKLLRSRTNSSIIKEETDEVAEKETPFIPKSWFSRSKQPQKADRTSPTLVAETVEDQSNGSEPATDGDPHIDVLSAPPIKHKPFKHLTRKPKYDPPFYCDPRLQKFDYNKRAQAIYQLHMESLKLYRRHGRASLVSATWDKPVQSSTSCRHSLVKAEEKLSMSTIFLDQIEEIPDASSITPEQPYVSRSGRITKRRLYDDQSSDSDTENTKKIKSEATYTPNLKTPLARKRTNLLSLKNEEIIKRSKLFNTQTRADAMFDRMRETEAAKEMEEKKMQEFQHSLDTPSDDEFRDDIASLVHMEEPFPQRRTEHVNPFRKKAAKSPNKSTEREKVDTGGNGPSRKQGKPEARRPASKEPNKYTPLTVASRKYKGCTLCGKRIQETQYDEHLQICSAETITEVNRSASTSASTIACVNCKKVFPEDANFEVHVRQCAKHRK